MVNDNTTLYAETGVSTFIYRSNTIIFANALHSVVAGTGIALSLTVIRFLISHSTMNFGTKCILVQQFAAGTLENMLGIARAGYLFNVRSTTQSPPRQTMWMCSILNAGEQAMTEVSSYLLLLLTIRIYTGTYCPTKQAQQQQRTSLSLGLTMGIIWIMPLAREISLFSMKEPTNKHSPMYYCNHYISPTPKMVEEAFLIMIDCIFIMSFVFLYRSNKRMGALKLNYDKNIKSLTFLERIWLDRSLKINRCLLPMLMLHCFFFVLTITTIVITKATESNNYNNIKASIYINEFVFQLGTSIIFCVQVVVFVQRDDFLRRKFRAVIINRGGPSGTVPTNYSTTLRLTKLT